MFFNLVQFDGDHSGDYQVDRMETLKVLVDEAVDKYNSLAGEGEIHQLLVTPDWIVDMELQAFDKAIECLKEYQSMVVFKRTKNETFKSFLHDHRRTLRGFLLELSSMVKFTTLAMNNPRAAAKSQSILTKLNTRVNKLV